MRENKITVYEAYILQGEVINYTRDWYTKPAWDGFVSISTCLEIFNQRLMALAFNDTAYAHTLQSTGQEAFRLCSEKRRHYIMDRYSDFMNIDYNSFDLLDELSAKRENCKYLEFDEGPFHYDVFPYNFFEPENVIRNNIKIDCSKSISAYVEKMLVDLNL